jgi:hypothetical protein
LRVLRWLGLAGGIAVVLFACSTHELAGAPGPALGGDSGANLSEAGADAGFNSGEEVRVTVPATGRAFVKLASPSTAVTPGDPTTDKTWDMAFGGVDAFTNSGPSGPGHAAAFGPLEGVVFLGDTVPDVPFVNSDVTGGAFANWFAYDQNAHVIYSRFHVFGIKDGDKTYKVQVLDYYEHPDAGDPIGAKYRIRYAELGQPDKELADIDGTAGGVNGGTADAPSACLDLGTGQTTMLSEAQARTSSAWHLCFRRTNISVNGDAGGPRNVGAVDLDAAQTAGEKLSDITQKTPASELAQFDAVTSASFTNQTFRGDHVVSEFTGQWTDGSSGVLTPLQVAWLVVGADGSATYLVGFERFEGATATSLGTVVMRAKAVK